MHRAFIIGRYVSRYGGAHKYLENLVRLLCSNGFTVIVGIEVHEEISEFCATLKSGGAQIANIPFDSKSPIEAAGVIDCVIQDFRPTVIDCEVAAKSVRNALPLSEEFKTSECVKLFTMHLAIKSETAAPGRFDMLNPFGYWRKGLKERREFLSMFDEGISVSDFHARRITELLKLKNDFFTYIPNGVDINKFRPTQNDNSIPVIGGCGSLVVQKRFDVLLGAALQLRESGCNFRIKIAGTGPESKKLQAFIEQHELNDVVELAGHQADVAKFMSELDIFVMCSDNEGFPYAQLEAMACGLPSVVTRVGDFPTMVHDNIEGYIIRKGDARQLSGVLVALMKDSGLRQKMGLNARKAVLQRYKKEDREEETLAKFVALSQEFRSIVN